MELTFLPLLIVLGAFMFFASRRQRKAMQATINLQDSLRVGDRIHTTSGMVGTIAGIGEDNIELEIAPGVITTWMKLAVRDRIDPDVAPLDEPYEGTAESYEGSAATEITDSTGTYGTGDGDITKR